MAGAPPPAPAQGPAKQECPQSFPVPPSYQLFPRRPLIAPFLSSVALLLLSITFLFPEHTKHVV